MWIRGDQILVSTPIISKSLNSFENIFLQRFVAIEK